MLNASSKTLLFKFYILIAVTCFYFGIVIVFKEVIHHKLSVGINVRSAQEDDIDFFSEVSDEYRLRQIVNNINRRQIVLNEDIFGSFRAGDKIIAIQVHNRTNYLKLTIEGLSKVRHIEKTLLIFSHSIFDVKINQIVRSIKFAKVMQIFYPHSNQLYPHSFPGDDPNDCPRDTKKEDAIEMKCNSANFPDKYGHYRESKFTQLRHHWFWRVNFIFDRLKVTQNFNGFVVLIEDDYYLLPDSLYLIDKMVPLTKNDSTCVYSLGIRENQNSNFKSDIIIKNEIIPKNQQILSKPFWETFKKFAQNYCNYDDCNFDTTFLDVCYFFVQPKPYSMFPLLPRVIHVGDCGVHFKTSANCFETFEKLNASLGTLIPNLFPPKLLVEKEEQLNTFGEWGGWADPRDRQLCMSFVNH